MSTFILYILYLQFVFFSLRSASVCESLFIRTLSVFLLLLFCFYSHCSISLYCKIVIGLALNEHSARWFCTNFIHPTRSVSFQLTFIWDLHLHFYILFLLNSCKYVNGDVSKLHEIVSVFFFFWNVISFFFLHGHRFLIGNIINLFFL